MADPAHATESFATVPRIGISKGPRVGSGKRCLMDYDLIATDLQRRALDKLAAAGMELTLEDRRLIRAEKQRLGLTNLPPTKSASHWVENLMMLEQIILRSGQPSRTSADPIERMLANWLARQRQSSGSLSAYAKARLRVSEAAHLDNAYDRRWRDNGKRLSTFVREHGRLPIVNRADADEMALARWWSRQMRAVVRDTMPPVRREMTLRLSMVAQALIRRAAA